MQKYSVRVLTQYTVQMYIFLRSKIKMNSIILRGYPMNKPNNSFLSMSRPKTGNKTHTFNVNLIFLKYNKHTITQKKS